VIETAHLRSRRGQENAHTEADVIRGAPMEIRLYKEEDRERWDRYVFQANTATCYHASGWKKIIEDSFGHKTYYLLAENEQHEMQGILPLVHLKSILFGNFMVSLPYVNYGGICADSREIEQQLFGAAVALASRKQAVHMELRHQADLCCGLPVKTNKVSMTLELRPRPGELWESFSAKLRNQIQRPMRELMHARLGAEEELDGFYSVFSQNMRDLGTPVYSKEFFQNILRGFPGSTKICTVYTAGGQPVAAGVLVGFKGRLEIPWASSIRTYNRHSPNMLLYWSALKYGCEQGYRVFDFGRSTRGEGTYKFKEQWGAKPVQLYWHYWIKDGGTLPELNPKNPKYRLAINIWKRLPLALTKFIGPALVKNLP